MPSAIYSPVVRPERLRANNWGVNLHRPTGPGQQNPRLDSNQQPWFGIIERRAIHRGPFRSVRELTAEIRAFIDGWNPRAQPFVWTKPPTRYRR